MNSGEKVLLVRIETSPEDIHGMNVAEGIVTARGGMTSHAAVLARSMGKPCIAGCTELIISYENRTLTIGHKTFHEGDVLTIEGATGKIIDGMVSTILPTPPPDFHRFMTWADEVRTLKVRANGDSPLDARVARGFGAEGIGLCRTEHMFFEKDRIMSMRQTILASDRKSRELALAKIQPIQRKDFLGIFREMANLPVTIRLLDPPLHEFLPNNPEDMQVLAKEMQVSEKDLHRRKEMLTEFNPMLGHRGCRLGISFPEIYRMQVRAIMEAACELKRTEKIVVEPEIMVPLISHWKELRFIRDYCEEEIQSVFQEQNMQINYSIGAMIELPRASLSAEKIADPKLGQAEFLSFGTNDLTQTCFGISRDDAGQFLGDYVENNIFPEDPFVSIDEDGVGELMKIAVRKALSVQKNMKLGICGEHGGEVRSIYFCHKLGLDYVSCSPFRVPAARLAAAQAALK